MNILDIFGTVLKPIGDFFTRRSEIKAQTHLNDLKVLEAQGNRAAEQFQSGLAADAAWEMEFARQAANSFKDDFILYALYIPLVLCFIPGGDRVVQKGFEAISGTPLWFQGLVITISLANYGIRQWRRTISDT